jgi:hypothetical protein
MIGNFCDEMLMSCGKSRKKKTDKISKKALIKKLLDARSKYQAVIDKMDALQVKGVIMGFDLCLKIVDSEYDISKSQGYAAH